MRAPSWLSLEIVTLDVADLVVPADINYAEYGLVEPRFLEAHPSPGELTAAHMYYLTEPIVLGDRHHFLAAPTATPLYATPPQPTPF